MNTKIMMIAAAAALGMTSCSSIEDALQEGSPLQLQAQLDNNFATRSVTALGGTWTVDDKMAVSDGTTPHEYAISDASTGAMSATSIPLCWGTNGENKALTAWSYGGAYNAALPTSWGVSTNQSTADNLQANDFMFASATATPDATTSLAFAHKLAKILIRVKCSNNTLTTANTTFSDVSVKVANTGTFSASSSSWSAPTGNTVAITPLTGAADGCLATYTALVLPQTINNTELFQFTASVDGIANTYAYTPVSQTLAAGSMQAFDINFDLDKVSVTSITASDWTTTDGGTITSTSTMIKKAAGTWTTSPDGTIKYNVNVGDIYYSDGSWSSTYDSSKTPIGVVVSTNPDYCEKAKGYGHGLVMALKNADGDGNGRCWGRDYNELLDNKTGLSEYYNDVSGLNNVDVIKNASRDVSIIYTYTYYAFSTATNYKDIAAVPSSSSGWFLPSIGQWWDALEKAATYNGSSLDLSNGHTGNVPWYIGDNEATIAAAAFNHLFSSHSLSSGLYDAFSASDEYYWSSSEFSSTDACLLLFTSSNKLFLENLEKNNNYRVRSFLAF